MSLSFRNFSLLLSLIGSLISNLLYLFTQNNSYDQSIEKISPGFHDWSGKLLITDSMRKRASLDLNRSPQRSPSPAAAGTEEVTSSKKDNSQEGYETPNTEKKKQRRAQVAKAVRKYYQKYTKKGLIEAKKTMNAEEFGSYMEMYKTLKNRDAKRNFNYNERQKHLRLQGDPIAIERHSKKTERSRSRYHKSKPKKDGNNAQTTKEDKDKAPPFTKRELQRMVKRTSLDLNRSPPRSPSPKGVNDQSTSISKQKSKRWDSQFTKKGQSEAKKMLSEEKYVLYKKQFDIHKRKKRMSARRYNDKEKQLRLKT